MSKASNHGVACAAFELRLEDHLNGALDRNSAAEVESHLEHCAGCREALAAARLGRELLGENLTPRAAPAGAFSTRVMAGIRAEAERREQFWRPLELLASRLALSAATLLMLLTVYVFEFVSPRPTVTVSSQARLSEGWPEPSAQPANPDDVLISIAENGHGR